MSTTAEIGAAVAAENHAIYADILSQAITGELIGMQNYTAMAGLFETQLAEFEDAVEHANSERGHANAFRRAARDLGVAVIEDVGAPYWLRIRDAFLRQVAAKDISACLIVQEIMLESFAVSMYDAVAQVTPGKLGQTFQAISREEEGHLDHALEELGGEMARDYAAFEAKVGRLHGEVMTILAEMVSARDPAGHCGLCAGDCVKGSLPNIGLSAPELRGKALNYYLRTLDRLGIRGEVSLSWVANLPA